MTGDLGITATMVWDVGITGDAEVANLPAVAITYGAADFTVRRPPPRRHRRRRLRHAVGPSHVHARANARRPNPVGALADARRGDRRAARGLRRGRVLPRCEPATAGWSPPPASTGRYACGTRDRPRSLYRRRRPHRSRHALDGRGLEPRRRPPRRRRQRRPHRPRDHLRPLRPRTVTVLQEDFGTAVGSVAFSPDGEQLITTRVPIVPYPGPDDGQLVIWDWTEGTVERTIATPAFIAATSPTEPPVAATNGWAQDLSGDSRRRLGHGHGAPRRDPRREHRGRMALAFSADGSRAGHRQRRRHGTDLGPDSGEQLLVLHGHDAMVTSVAFSPDGSRLASVGADGTLRVWALDLDDLVEIAESELTRTLTDQECQQYLHVPRCL